MNEKATSQMEVWAGDFGYKYTDRNPHTVEALDQLYQENVGIARTAMNRDFLDGLDRQSKILEVGANLGVQLRALQDMGFENLYGIELQHYAVELGKKHNARINVIQGSAFDIPFRDGWFDLVFTSGVLIHIPPSDIPGILSEVHRCSRRWLWGYEYFADTHTEIP